MNSFKGFIEIADIARLIQLGAIETAIAVAEAFAGIDTAASLELLEAIEDARRAALQPIFPTARPRSSLEHGGFIPSGQTVNATLHPEVVVPLGSNTMALRALTMAMNGIPGGGVSGEGFRNYGIIQVLAADDNDRGAMNSMRRALGA